jgi:hypothetical protein
MTAEKVHAAGCTSIKGRRSATAAWEYVVFDTRCIRIRSAKGELLRSDESWAPPPLGEMRHHPPPGPPWFPPPPGHHGPPPPPPWDHGPPLWHHGRPPPPPGHRGSPPWHHGPPHHHFPH